MPETLLGATGLRKLLQRFGDPVGTVGHHRGVHQLPAVGEVTWALWSGRSPRARGHLP